MHHAPHRRSRSAARRAFLCGAVALLLGICAADAAAQPGPGAGKPPPGRDTFHQYAEGLLVRPVFASDSAGAYRVEVWDLLVGPGMRSAEVRLPGGAVCEVRAGSGVLRREGGRDLQLAPGATFTLSEGARFVVANGRDDLGLSIHAVIVSRREP